MHTFPILKYHAYSNQLHSLVCFSLFCFVFILYPVLTACINILILIYRTTPKDWSGRIKQSSIQLSLTDFLLLKLEYTFFSLMFFLLSTYRVGYIYRIQLNFMCPQNLFFCLILIIYLNFSLLLIFLKFQFQFLFFYKLNFWSLQY